jgi:hypothetical protein
VVCLALENGLWHQLQASVVSLSSPHHLQNMQSSSVLSHRLASSISGNIRVSRRHAFLPRARPG